MDAGDIANSFGFPTVKQQSLFQGNGRNKENGLGLFSLQLLNKSKGHGLSLGRWNVNISDI